MGPGKRVKVLLDTNTILYILEGIIAPSHIMEALEAAYELVLPKTVVEELERLASSAPRASIRRRARRALSLLQQGVLDVTILEYEYDGPVDDSLVELALELKAQGERVIVATSDKELRAKLRRRGIPSLYYRESSGLLEAEWLEP